MAQPRRRAGKKDWTDNAMFFNGVTLQQQVHAKNEKFLISVLNGSQPYWAWPRGGVLFVIKNKNEFHGSEVAIEKVKHILGVSEKFVTDHFVVEKDECRLFAMNEIFLSQKQIVQNCKKDGSLSEVYRVKILQFKNKGKKLYYEKKYGKAQDAYEIARRHAQNLADSGGEAKEDILIRAQIAFNLSILARDKKQWELVWTLANEALELQPEYSKALKMRDIAEEHMKISI